MSKPKLYAVYDNGRLIGDYSSMEAAELLEIPRNVISAYASSGARALGRYTFEAVDVLDIRPLLQEWDRTRLGILRRGR